MTKVRKPKVRHVPDEMVEVQSPGEQKRGGGKPSRYDSSMCAKVENWGAQGWSFVQIAVELEVTRQTLHNWAKRHPEFFDALTRAREAALAYWERVGEAGITAEKFNSTVWVKLISSRWPQEYGRQVEPDFQTITQTDDHKPKTLDLSVVDPDHRDLVLRALIAMKEAAEAQEDEA